MRAGRLRHMVTIQTSTATRDAAGAEVLAWSELVQCWAGIEPLTGRELQQAGAEQTEYDVRIVTRYVPGVTTRCRVVREETPDEAQRTYQILAVVNRNERGAELELRCIEQVTK